MKSHPKLLVGGVWCIADIDYEHGDDKSVVPGSWQPQADPAFPLRLRGLRRGSRRHSRPTSGSICLMQTIGFNPEMFGRRSKLIQLVRLIPFVERNYNLD